MLLFLIKLNDHHTHMKLDMGLCSHMMSIGCLGEIIGYNINATVTIKTKYTITDRRHSQEGWDVGNQELKNRYLTKMIVDLKCEFFMNSQLNCFNRLSLDILMSIDVRCNVKSFQHLSEI